VRKGSSVRDCYGRVSVPRIAGLLLLIGWLAWLLCSLLRLCRLVCRDRKQPDTPNVPPWAYRQPDPLIYSQQYLQAQGLAVTWNNPDIHLESPGAPGVPVDSHDLQPDTDYLVIARVWNGSTTAPAPGLPVHVSFLEFGIGTTRHDVGQTAVDLAVKGAAGCPAFATVGWHTPATPGHYCLQVQLIWDDDANPANNMGQHNTDVKPLNSPHAAFDFPLRNGSETALLLRLQADAYDIPPPPECQPDNGPDAVRRRRARHNRAAWPLPAGWQVAVTPAEARLDPGQSTQVTADITAPDGYVGRQAINVNAYAGQALVGGVTFYVEGNG
jgi:hypothetical protein